MFLCISSACFSLPAVAPSSSLNITEAATSASSFTDSKYLVQKISDLFQKNSDWLLP